MFAIGDKEWAGISKAIEEIGELQIELGRLQQTFGKLIGSRGATDHWSGDLKRCMEDEMGDVQAAIDFFITHASLDCSRIADRRKEKLDKFNQWHFEQPEQ